MIFLGTCKEANKRAVHCFSHIFKERVDQGAIGGCLLRPVPSRKSKLLDCVFVVVLPSVVGQCAQHCLGFCESLFVQQETARQCYLGGESEAKILLRGSGELKSIFLYIFDRDRFESNRTLESQLVVFSECESKGNSTLR